MGVTVVITSFNRKDLLERTIESFLKFNTYPIEDFIIIEDSGNKQMNEFLVKKYSHYHLILHETNMGLVESIDDAYSYVKTPYVFHTEDDFEYHKSGFIEKSLEILKSKKDIMQVYIRPPHMTIIPVEPEIYKTGETSYQLFGDTIDGYWHGFCFQCGLRKMSAYEKIKPFTQWSSPEKFITTRESMIGDAYWKLGYRVAILMEGYANHTGRDRSTYGLYMS